MGVLIAYFPTLRNGFVWDDDNHVTIPGLRSLHGLWRIWFQPGATQQYYPLLHSAFWFEYSLWRDAAFSYHIVNCILHASAAILVGWVLRRLAIPGAFLAAAIFALHPVNVESVAWISEQKNTLSTVFYLGAALTYLRFDAIRQRAWYALALGLFFCALLTKSVTATLPCALLVIFWWQRGRLAWRRDVLPLVPWIAAGIVAGLHTAWIERTVIGADGAAFEFTLLQRVLLAPHVIAFYLEKLLWPGQLTFIYPRWTIDPTAPLAWLALLGALALTAALWFVRHRSRAPLAAWLFYVGSLFPVLGFFNVYPFQYSFVADHFQYLASLGMIVFAAAGTAHLTARTKMGTGLIATILFIALGLLTWRQTEIYRDSSTLFHATIERNPSAWMAYNNLGRLLVNDKARLPEAIALFERSLALRPANAEALSNLGLALAQTGRAEEAIPRLEYSLRLNPKLYQAHNNYAIALAGAGRPQDALAEFARAAQLNPYLPQIHDNWGKVCQMLGQNAEAAEHFAEAARLRSRPAGSEK